MEESRSAFPEPHPQTLGMPAQRTAQMPVPNAGPLPTQLWGQPPAPMPGQMSAPMAAQMSPQIGGYMPVQYAAHRRMPTSLSQWQEVPEKKDVVRPARPGLGADATVPCHRRPTRQASHP